MHTLASVAIELTAYCNQRCDYCYNAWREEPRSGATEPRDHTLARVRKLLTRVEVERVTLTGGEPFAFSGLYPLLELLKKHQVPFQMISNGGLIDHRHATRLAEYEPSYVQVTLNGPNRELHEAHVGLGHWDSTLAGIEHLNSAGIRVVGCVVLTRKNHDRLGATLELWRELGARYVAISRFSPAGYAARHAGHLLPSRSQLIAGLAQAAAFGQRYPDFELSCTMPVPPCVVETEDLAPVRFGSCSIGTAGQEFALGPDGRLRNCTLHETPLLGDRDLLDDDVDPEDLLLSPELTEYRKQRPEFCAGCVHEQTCGGGCGAAAEWVLGHARKYPDPIVWQHLDAPLSDRLTQERDGKTHLDLML